MFNHQRGWCAWRVSGVCGVWCVACGVLVCVCVLVCYVLCVCVCRVQCVCGVCVCWRCRRGTRGRVMCCGVFRCVCSVCSLGWCVRCAPCVCGVWVLRGSWCVAVAVLRAVCVARAAYAHSVRSTGVAVAVRSARAHMNEVGVQCVQRGL